MVVLVDVAVKDSVNVGLFTDTGGAASLCALAVTRMICLPVLGRHETVTAKIKKKTIVYRFIPGGELITYRTRDDPHRQGKHTPWPILADPSPIIVPVVMIVLVTVSMTKHL